MISKVSSPAIPPPAIAVKPVLETETKVTTTALSAIAGSEKSLREAYRSTTSLKIRVVDVTSSEDSLETGPATGGGTMYSATPVRHTGSTVPSEAKTIALGPNLEFFKKNSTWINSQITAISKKTPPISEVEKLFKNIILNAAKIGSGCSLAGRVRAWDSGIYCGFLARKETELLETSPREVIYEHALLHKMPDIIRKLIFSPLFSIQDTFEDKIRFLALAEIKGQKRIIEATIDDEGSLYHLFARPLNYEDGKLNSTAKEELDKITEELRAGAKTCAGMKKPEGTITVEGVTFNSKTNEAIFKAPLGNKAIHDHPKTPKHVKDVEAAVGFEDITYKLKMLKEIPFGT
jgi:hypothetical protein